VVVDGNSSSNGKLKIGIVGVDLVTPWVLGNTGHGRVILLAKTSTELHLMRSEICLKFLESELVGTERSGFVWTDACRVVIGM
jgi:hypothetical protein